MATQQQVLELHRKHPHMTAPEIATRLGCMPEYVRTTARRRALSLPGGRVPVENFAALLAAMEAIRDGLADTGSVPGHRMTTITKAEAFGIADAAVKAARARR